MNNLSRLRFRSHHPYYLFLLPVFFVFHGFAENYGFIGVKDALLLLLSYLLMSLLIFFFSYIFFRNWTRAALITVIWLFFFFFFGAIHEFLKQHSQVRLFSRYSFLIPICITFLVFVFVYLKKSEKIFQRFNWFLNTLLLIYILIDLGTIVWRAIRPPETKLSVYAFSRKKDYNSCDTCHKPNIYFLLFDEYASSTSLKEKFHFENDIDTFLISKGFRIQRHSRSNYNFTIFSMSSILNMSYVEGIKNIQAVTAEDYGAANLLVRQNEVITFLDLHGYDIVNYSMFDLAGHPTMVQQSLLPLNTKLITGRTLFARMNKDIGWLLMTKFPFNLFKKTHYLIHLDNDNKFLDLVIKAPTEKTKKPRFIYAHFNMPHVPYFFDKNGKLKDNATIYLEFKTSPVPSYLEFIQYTNSQMRKIIENFLKYDPMAVIVIMGDHGFRIKELSPNFHFQNFNAVYFPDRDYSLLYDSITGANQFRMVLNKIFHQSFPKLKDTTIFLRDKQ